MQTERILFVFTFFTNGIRYFTSFFLVCVNHMEDLPSLSSIDKQKIIYSAMRKLAIQIEGKFSPYAGKTIINLYRVVPNGFVMRFFQPLANIVKPPLD